MKKLFLKTLKSQYSLHAWNSFSSITREQSFTKTSINCTKRILLLLFDRKLPLQRFTKNHCLINISLKRRKREGNREMINYSLRRSLVPLVSCCASVTKNHIPGPVASRDNAEDTRRKQTWRPVYTRYSYSLGIHTPALKPHDKHPIKSRPWCQGN